MLNNTDKSQLSYIEERQARNKENERLLIAHNADYNHDAGCNLEGYEKPSSESDSINKACCLNCYHDHCPIIKLVAELSDNPMVSTEFYCQQYLAK